MPLGSQLAPGQLIRERPRAAPSTLRWRVGMPVTFVGLSFLVTLPLWLGSRPRLPGYGADTALHLWFFSWFPYAISHGINPFVTTIGTYPMTSNLLWNNADLPLGLLSWPLFHLVGAAVAMGIVYGLLLAAAASAMAWQLRRHVRHPSSAWLGGLLFGFSPFAQSEMAAGHLTLVNTATLPLGWWVGERALGSLRSRRHRVLWGMAAGGWLVLQYWVGKELLATTALMGVLLLALNFRSVVRAGLGWLRGVGPFLLAALGLFALLMAFPLAVQASSGVPLGVPTVVSPKTNVIDLLAFLLPGYSQLLGLGSLGALNGHFSGVFLETDAYLGPPLLALAAWVAVRRRADPLVRIGASCAALGAVLALGGDLHVAGVDTRIPLPWLLFEHLPIYAKVVPSRLTVFVVAGVACLLAAGWDQIMEAARPGVRATSLGILLLPLLPSSGLVSGWAGFPVSLPAVLTSAPLMRLPAGAPIVTVPITTPDNHGLTMYWQAVLGFRYAQPFGYLLHESPGGVLTDANPPSPLEAVLSQMSAGNPAPSGVSSAEVRSQLRSWRIAALVVTPQRGLAAEVRSWEGILGRPPRMIDGAAVWFSPGRAPA